MFGFRAAATGVPPQDHSGRIHACVRARMHACTGRRRLSARTLSASAHRSAAACAAASRAPRCCAASRRRAMTAHSQQGPIRHAHAASARQRAAYCAASRAHACVCAPAGAWCQSKAQHSQGAQAAQGCAVPGGTRGELRLIKFVAVRCNRMRYNASHKAVQVGQSVPAQMWASPGADNGQLVPAQMWRRCNPNTLGEKGMAAARRVTEDH